MLQNIRFSTIAVAMLVWLPSLGITKEPVVTSTEPLTIKLVASKVVVDKHGKEKLQVAANARPGDVIEYKATYKNNGRDAIVDLMATLPIPKDTEYMANSAIPIKGVEGSVDGIEFAPLPLGRHPSTGKLLQASERDRPDVVEVVVPLAEYRVLRWQFPHLKPKAAQVVRARAVVVTAEP